MTKFVLICATLAMTAAMGFAQKYRSPAADTTVTIAGKAITINTARPRCMPAKFSATGA